MILKLKKHFENISAKQIAISIVCLIILILSFCISNASVFAEDVPNLKFEDMTLEEELESIPNFSWSLYPAKPNSNLATSIFKFVEYCFPYYENYKSNYCLYLYLYNPSCTQYVENGKNKITLSTSWDIVDNAQIATNYEKFDLKLVSKTTGVKENLFLKFKVIDKKVNGLSMYERVNRNDRQYDISEVELHKKGDLSPSILQGVGGQFNFNGYSKGYGEDPKGNSTLQTRQTGLSILNPDVEHTFFRTETSEQGKGFQNQLDGVYFNIDKNIVEKYGVLKRIKAEWYEYRTSPIVALHDEKVYNDAFSKLGTKKAPNPSFGINYFGNNPEYPTASWVYTSNPNTINLVGKPGFASTFLTYVEKCDKNNIEDWYYKGEDLRRYIYAYNKSTFTGRVQDIYSDVINNYISNDLFMPDVDAGHTRGYNSRLFDADQINDQFNLLDYASNHNGWEKFFDYFWSYPKNEQSYLNIPPIMKVEKSDIDTLNDYELSKKYFIDKRDIDDFRSYFEKYNRENHIYKFNFSHSQYFSNIVGAWYGSQMPIFNEYGLMAQETVYLQFDMIHVEFKNDLGYHLMPVAMSPIDAIADITPPPFMNNKPKIPTWVWVLIALLLFAILSPILIPILKVVFMIIALPFKAIFALFKGSKKDKQTVNVVVSSAPTSGKTKKRKVSQNEIELAKKRFNKKE